MCVCISLLLIKPELHSEIGAIDVNQRFFHARVSCQNITTQKVLLLKQFGSSVKDMNKL